jgi:hypothetical protein
MVNVIRVSKQGFNVLNSKEKRKELPTEKLLPHLLYALALTYLLGAKKQLERYKIATLTLEKSPINRVYACLHEASTLFEDLCTVGKYVEICKDKNELHQLWFDVRNHIRHDIREEFDNESSPRKKSRADRLKIAPQLQTDIEFTSDSIKIGESVIEINIINNYLEWAEKVIFSVLNNAKKRGDLVFEKSS